MGVDNAPIICEPNEHPFPCTDSRIAEFMVLTVDAGALRNNPTSFSDFNLNDPRGENMYRVFNFFMDGISRVPNDNVEGALPKQEVCFELLKTPDGENAGFRVWAVLHDTSLNYGSIYQQIIESNANLYANITEHNNPNRQSEKQRRRAFRVTNVGESVAPQGLMQLPLPPHLSHYHVRDAVQFGTMVAGYYTNTRTHHANKDRLNNPDIDLGHPDHPAHPSSKVFNTKNAMKRCSDQVQMRQRREEEYFSPDNRVVFPFPALVWRIPPNLCDPYHISRRLFPNFQQVMTIGVRVEVDPSSNVDVFDQLQNRSEGLVDTTTLGEEAPYDNRLNQMHESQDYVQKKATLLAVKDMIVQKSDMKILAQRNKFFRENILHYFSRHEVLPEERVRIMTKYRQKMCEDLDHLYQEGSNIAEGSLHCIHWVQTQLKRGGGRMRLNMRRYMFDDRLSFYGQMVARILNEFEHGLDVRVAHIFIYLLSHSPLNALHYKLDALKLNFLITGDKAVGKSFAALLVLEMTCPGMMETVNHETKQSNNTEDDHDNLCKYLDELKAQMMGEANKNRGYGSNAQGNDYDSQWKELLTKGYTVSKPFEFTPEGKRVQVTKCSSRNQTVIASTNYSKANMTGPLVNRFYPKSMPRDDRKTASMMQNGHAGEEGSDFSRDEILYYHQLTMACFDCVERLIETHLLDVDMSAMNYVFDHLRTQFAAKGIDLDADQRNAERLFLVAREQTIRTAVERYVHSEASAFPEYVESFKPSMFLGSDGVGIGKFLVCTTEIALASFDLCSDLFEDPYTRTILRLLATEAKYPDPASVKYPKVHEGEQEVPDYNYVRIDLRMHELAKKIHNNMPHPKISVNDIEYQLQGFTEQTIAAHNRTRDIGYEADPAQPKHSYNTMTTGRDRHGNPMFCISVAFLQQYFDVRNGQIVENDRDIGEMAYEMCRTPHTVPYRTVRFQPYRRCQYRGVEVDLPHVLRIHDVTPNPAGACFQNKTQGRATRTERLIRTSSGGAKRGCPADTTAAEQSGRKILNIDTDLDRFIAMKFWKSMMFDPVSCHNAVAQRHDLLIRHLRGKIADLPEPIAYPTSILDEYVESTRRVITVNASATIDHAYFLETPFDQVPEEDEYEFIQTPLHPTSQADALRQQLASTSLADEGSDYENDMQN